MEVVLLNGIIEKAAKLEPRGNASMRKFYLMLYALFMLLFLIGNLFAQDSSSQISTLTNDEETIYKQSEVDQKAKVLKRSYPATDGKCIDDSGFARVLVILHKSGKVSDVKFLIASECQRFNENSLDSAKKIKFKPALKDGQPVSVSVMVEFKYQRY